MSGRATPAARAYIGTLALDVDSSKLDDAAKLAGYEINAATPVCFHEGRCYRRPFGARLVVRDGQVVRLVLNDYELDVWLRRLASRLSASFEVEKAS